MRAFAAAGVHGACAVTAVTVQNSKGVRDIVALPRRLVEEQLDAVAQDLAPRWAKTGMLFSADVCDAVAIKLAEYRVSAVVDPVLVATSGDNLSEERLVETIRRELLPHAALVTPNAEEAGALLRGRRVRGVEDLKRAAEDIRELGPGAVLVKGGHVQVGDAVVDVLCTGPGRFEEFRHRRRPGTFHGTGCALSALAAAHLALGDAVPRAVATAERAVQSAIEAAYAVGGGALFLDHMVGARMAAMRWEVARAVRLAARQLEVSLTGEWVPEVGMNVCYALPYATSYEDVAALSGRIHRVCDRAQALGHVNYGASRYMSSVVLAAMRHDPDARAAVNLRRTEDHLRRAREAGLRVASFERAATPADADPEVEWGTGAAIMAYGAVPDVVEDAGGLNAEPQMRVLGRDPAEVVDKVRRIIARE
jgi:hydroxymethylpyrimidine kinase/phosphomethylpyrimidine kinase